MSRSVNKVILIGNLGQAPEIRYMPSTNQPVATLSIATSESWKDKNGEKQEKTEWHRIVLFSKLSEIAQKYLNKGSKVYIEGSLHTRKWVDNQTGQDRYTTEIKGHEIIMLEDKPMQQNLQHADSLNQSKDSQFDDDIPF